MINKFLLNYTCKIISITPLISNILSKTQSIHSELDSLQQAHHVIYRYHIAQLASKDRPSQ